MEAWGRSVGICTNVEIRQCGESGVVAYKGGRITLMGSKTTVRDNCTKALGWDYGLRVSDSPSSTIQLVHPLTKEIVSKNNDQNWGANYGGADIHQIKTITREEFEKQKVVAITK